MEDTNVVLSPLAISILAGTIIPILTGIVTKLKSSVGVKAIVAFALSAIAGTATQIVKMDEFDPEWALYLTASTFVVNVAMYLGIWQPTGRDGTVPLQKATKDIGFGAPGE